MLMSCHLHELQPFKHQGEHLKLPQAVCSRLLPACSGPLPAARKSGAAMGCHSCQTSVVRTSLEFKCQAAHDDRSIMISSEYFLYNIGKVPANMTEFLRDVLRSADAGFQWKVLTVDLAHAAGPSTYNPAMIVPVACSLSSARSYNGRPHMASSSHFPAAQHACTM